MWASSRGGRFPLGRLGSWARGRSSVGRASASQAEVSWVAAPSSASSWLRERKALLRQGFSCVLAPVPLCPAQLRWKPLDSCSPLVRNWCALAVPPSMDSDERRNHEIQGEHPPAARVDAKYIGRVRDDARHDDRADEREPGEGRAATSCGFIAPWVQVQSSPPPSFDEVSGGGVQSVQSTDASSTGP